VHGTGYTPPIYYYSHGGRDAAITGGFVYRGLQFPEEYVGSYFFADYAQRWIKRLTFDAAGNVAQVLNFWPPDGSPDGPWGDIVYLAEGPDGALYYVDIGFDEVNGTLGVASIRRIRYVGSGNQPPLAAASANPTTGPAPLTVAFRARDPQTRRANPSAIRGLSGDSGTSAVANPSHTYSEPGQYTVRLTVSDGATARWRPRSPSWSGTRRRPRCRHPPMVDYSKPVRSSPSAATPPTRRTASCPLARLPGTSIFIMRRTSIRDFPINGVKSGSFQIPTTGHDFSGTTFYEFKLKVSDSSGLESSKSVFIYPTK
jgi:hypothetical protein